MEGTPRRAVRSIIGTSPSMQCSVSDRVICDIPSPFSEILTDLKGDDPIDLIRSVIRTFSIPQYESPGFFGGLVGYCTYDMVTALNRGMVKSTDNPEVPVARFFFSTQGIVYDHVRELCFIYDTPLITAD